MIGVTVFDFEESSVRSVVIDGEPWFVGKDVCGCLEIANHRDALGRLESDERQDGVGITDPIGRQQFPIFVNEPGIYRLVFTSRTDAAERFKRWIAHDVLPAIRKTGRYVADAMPDRDDLIDDAAFDDLRRAAPILREWRLLYGRAAARRMARRLPIPRIDTHPLCAPETDIDDARDGVIDEFSHEVMQRQQGASATASDVYASYLAWCRDNEVRPESQTAFGRRLADLGWSKRRVSGRVMYCDVGFCEPDCGRAEVTTSGT